MPNIIKKDIHTIDQKSFRYIFEQNATVSLKSSEGLVRCNIYRPKNLDKVPVLVTYGPYGKDIHYKEYASLCISWISTDFPVSTHSRPAKSILTTTHHIRLGRPPTPDSGPITDMLSYEQMNAAWANRQVYWIQCHEARAKISSM